MNRVAGRTSRALVGVLMFAIAAYGTPTTFAASPSPVSRTSEIVGNVFGPDALSTVSGVSVKAAHTITHKVYASQATGADGLYKLSDLPPGSYDLAVQTREGLYPADALVEVKAGRRTMVSLAIRSEARQDKPEGEKKEGDKPADQPPAEPPQGEKPPEPPPQPPAKKKGGGFWRSPAGAAIAIVGGAALIGVAANSAASDDEEDTPPLTQSGN